MASTNCAEGSSKLTAAQKATVERNRKKALQLRQSRLAKRPHEKGKESDQESKIKRAPIEVDTGSGFFFEAEELGNSSPKDIKQEARKVLHEPAPVIDADNLFCDECSRDFLDSYLYSKFDHPVCDKCRGGEKYDLIARTDAKSRFLLKDEDFDKREPELKFILRKNPHNRFGDMKLYLLCQVKQRALEVWGSEEKIEEALEQRNENREKAKQKKFNKKLKELRMSVRSSLWRKDLSGHKHEYDEEVYDEDEDTYSKTCTSCGHVWTYEKM